MSKNIVASQIDNLPDTSKYKPKYTPVNQVNDLLKKGLSYTQIGKLLGIHHSAVCRLIQRHGLNPVEDECYKKNRADILVSKQRLLLNNVTVAAVKKMPVRDNIVSFGILYDKERLERGLSVTEGIIDVLLAIHQSLFPKQVGDNSDNIIDVTPNNDDSHPPNTEKVTIE